MATKATAANSHQLGINNQQVSWCLAVAGEKAQISDKDLQVARGLSLRLTL
jgi:hypothetical protein